MTYPTNGYNVSPYGVITERLNPNEANNRRASQHAQHVQQVHGVGIPILMNAGPIPAPRPALVLVQQPLHAAMQDYNAHIVHNAGQPQQNALRPAAPRPTIYINPPPPPPSGY